MSPRSLVVGRGMEDATGVRSTRRPDSVANSAPDDQATIPAAFSS